MYGINQVGCPGGLPEFDRGLELVMGIEMKKVTLLATALAMVTGSAFAADMPLKAVKAPPVAAFDPWDEDGAPPRTAAELVEGLEATWQMIRDCLDRWTPAMLDDPFTRERPHGTVTRTRQWILWHVIEHDLHHGGELCLTLGMHGLPVPDL